MSLLTGKHVLVIGEENEQISKIEAALVTYGADITTTTCAAAEADKIISQGIDLVLVNHLHEGIHCKEVLQALQVDDIDYRIPVLTLVQNDQAHMSDVLMLGAADYFTPEEDVHTTVDKIKKSLGDEDVQMQTASAIDITPIASPTDTGTRVFVVEDDPLLRNLLAIRFERANIPFEITDNGEGIIQKLDSFDPHVVVLDLMLPGRDGLAVLEEVRQSAHKNIPVIVFSNKDNPEDRSRAEELGVVAFRVKAMTELSELLQLIETHAKK